MVIKFHYILSGVVMTFVVGKERAKLLLENGDGFDAEVKYGRL